MEELQATVCQHTSAVCQLALGRQGPCRQFALAPTHLYVIFPFTRLDSGKTNHLGRLHLLFPLLELEVSPCLVSMR